MTLRPAFADPNKTYASHQNAVKAFHRAAAKIGLTDMVYIIASTPEGRFYPVALPSEAQVPHAISLAHTSSVCLFRH